MATGREVTAPDGDRWRVRRRWLDRQLPSPWRRFRKTQEQVSGGRGLDALDGAYLLDTVVGTVLICVVVLLVGFVLLPLLGVALELVFVLFLIFSGILGRVILIRPWTILAENLDRPERSAVSKAKGWRASGEEVERIAREISAGGPGRAAPAP